MELLIKNKGKQRFRSFSAYIGRNEKPVQERTLWVAKGPLDKEISQPSPKSQEKILHDTEGRPPLYSTQGYSEIIRAATSITGLECRV